jgi:ketosteroid isomerase-like protein
MSSPNVVRLATEGGATMSQQAIKRTRRLMYRESPEDPKIADRNRQTMLDVMDQLERGEYGAFWKIFDPDVVFYEADSLPYGGVHTGLKAAQDGYAHMSSMFSEMHATFEQILAAGDIVILYLTMSFRVKTNDKTGSMPVVEMFRFRDGKVVEWRVLYFDAAMVAGALAG